MEPKDETQTENSSVRPAVDLRTLLKEKDPMASRLSGQTLGKYRILSALGRGGMSQVYRAYHPQLDRYVAVKVLRSDLVEDEEFLSRFRREAQAVAALRHPNIVQVYDFDVQGDIYYMVMELLEGDTLKAYLSGYRSQQKKLPYNELVRILVDTLNGLAYAHSEGVIHRDIKPANILLTRHGLAVITDFGIAQIVGGTQYTVQGALMGTLSYMAPEQGLEGRTGIHSDIYSMGILFYEMLTGRPPYEADTPLAVLMKHVNDPLPLPREMDPEIPEEFERIVLKALAKQPDDRYASTEEMRQALISAAEQLSIGIPENIHISKLASQVSAGNAKPIGVFSGDEKKGLEKEAINADDTDIDLGKRLNQMTNAAEAFVDDVRLGSLETIKVQKGQLKRGPRAMLPAGVALIGYNVVVAMLGLISGNWGLYQRGWTVEILLICLGLIAILEFTEAPAMAIPIVLILGNGVLLSYTSVTSWWTHWSFLWPLEVILIGSSLLLAFWLGGNGKDHLPQITKWLTNFTIVTTLVVIVASILIWW